MKITRRQLRRLIKEELSRINEIAGDEKVDLFTNNIGKHVRGSGYPGATIAGAPSMSSDGKMLVPVKTSGPIPDLVPIEKLTIIDLEKEAEDIDHSELEEELDTILLGFLHVPGWHDEGGQGPWEDWGHPYLKDEELALSKLQEAGLTPERAKEYIDEFMEWATEGTGKSSMVGVRLDQALIDYEQSG